MLYFGSSVCCPTPTPGAPSAFSIPALWGGASVMAEKCKNTKLQQPTDFFPAPNDWLAQWDLSHLAVWE